MRVDLVAIPIGVLLFVGTSCGGTTVSGPPGAHRNSAAEMDRWTIDSRNLSALGSGAIQWPQLSEIESFFPLGFSSDGWFAYSNRLEGLQLREPLGTCTSDVPCFDLSLLNVLCDTPCAGDIDPDAGPNCRCIRGVGIKELEALSMKPAGNVGFGEFPIHRDGRVYDIEVSYKERAGYPEVLTQPRRPEFPETQVYLVDDHQERRLLATIDHNHSGIGIGVRVAGWLKHPYVDRYIVLLLCRRTAAVAEGAPPYFLLPVVARLK